MGNKMASERHYLPTNCCFVFSIRTGAIILAVLGIFGGGMNIISESYGLAVMAPDIETYIDQYRSEILEQFGTSTPTPEEQAYLDQLMRQLDFLKDLVPWVFVIKIVYASIQFIVSFSLLIGIVNNKPGLMKPWLIVTMFTLLAGFAVLHGHTIFDFGILFLVCGPSCLFGNPKSSVQKQSNLANNFSGCREKISKNVIVINYNLLL